MLNRAGGALTTLDARRMVNRIARAAGCRHITPHGLRRTFCTAGLVSGVPMRDMQIATLATGVASFLADMAGETTARAVRARARMPDAGWVRSQQVLPRC